MVSAVNWTSFFAETTLNSESHLVSSLFWLAQYNLSWFSVFNTSLKTTNVSTNDDYMITVFFVPKIADSWQDLMTY